MNICPEVSSTKKYYHTNKESVSLIFIYKYHPSSYSLFHMSINICFLCLYFTLLILKSCFSPYYYMKSLLLKPPNLQILFQFVYYLVFFQSALPCPSATVSSIRSFHNTTLLQIFIIAYLDKFSSSSYHPFSTLAIRAKFLKCKSNHVISYLKFLSSNTELHCMLFMALRELWPFFRLISPIFPLFLCKLFQPY